MIATLRGSATAVHPGALVIEVGGVGHYVNCTPSLVASVGVGEEVLLHTSLVVRDDALTIFGFRAPEELRVFELLLTVNGVGAKSAVSVLSAMTPTEVARAVAGDDDSAFRKVSGIGPKTAKQITNLLTGRLDEYLQAAAPAAGAAPGAEGHEVVSALVGLGWSERPAMAALQEVLDENPEAGDDTSELLRLTLAKLGRTRVVST